jgi:hypothetical protein
LTLTEAPTLTVTEASPTNTPTYAPITFSPTLSSPVTVALSVQQVINNVDLSNSTKEQINNCLITTIALSATVPGGKSLATSDIINFQATPSRRRLAQNLAASSTNLNLAYEIYIANSLIPQQTYQDQLQNAVKSGQFTKTLQNQAIVQGVPALAAATSTSVKIIAATSTPTRTPTVYSTGSQISSDDNNGLSGGAIAGIVIGSVFGAGLIFGILYYFLVMRKKSEGPLYTPLVDRDTRASTDNKKTAIFY